MASSPVIAPLRFGLEFLIIILARRVSPIGSLSPDFYPHSPRIGPKDRLAELDKQLAIPLRLEFLGEGFGPVGILPVS